jgi:phosphohistidine phosphatase
MRRLLLMRHAKSDWTAGGQRDVDRALAERGRKVAPMMGHYLARHGLRPDKMLVSSARRTRETCDLMLPAFPDAPPVVYDARLYDAQPEGLLAIVQETEPGSHTLMVIGHNPAMQELSDTLTGSGDIRARQSMVTKFPTAALAVIDFAVDRWDRVEPHSGRLDRFVTPHSLDGEADD